MEIDSCTGPYLRSKSVQVSKKASVYAAFHCCRGVQVCPVLVRFPLFLYTCTTMKTPVFMRVCAIVVHFLIPGPGATASATAPAATACGVCAAYAASFPPAAPVQAVERCSTPRKLLKKFDQNFYSASRFSSSSSVLNRPHSSNSRSPSWCNWAISSLNWVTRS